MSNTTATHVRWAIRRDMPAIVRIEQETFGGLTEDDFLAHFRNRNTIPVIAELGDEVVGFAVYQVLPRTIRVLVLTSLTPEGRKGLIAKMRAKSAEHRKPLKWKRC